MGPLKYCRYKSAKWGLQRTIDIKKKSRIQNLVEDMCDTWEEWKTHVERMQSNGLP
jgi:hypothetical protein